jgi:putative transposase
MYLFIIIDWYSRYIVDYKLSSTLYKSFVESCLKRAQALQKLKIINSNRGNHFTNQGYIDLLEAVGGKFQWTEKVSVWTRTIL